MTVFVKVNDLDNEMIDIFERAPNGHIILHTVANHDILVGLDIERHVLDELEEIRISKYE